jgi:pimeloyl-ACP methyl ester carboxylesterase
MILWDDEFCALLAARGRYVVRFDNRDIGLSTKLDGAPVPGIAQYLLSRLPGVKYRAPYTLRDMAQDAVGLLDALGIDRAHVVGASMGGAIAQEMALHFRSRLHTLTAIMSTTGNPKLPRPTRAAFAVLLRRAPLEREAFLKFYVDTWRVLSGDVMPFDAERTRRTGLATYERGVNPAGVGRQLAAIVASGDRHRALRSVDVPALVIHGTADPLVRYPAALDLCAAIRGATLVPIAGMGHALPRQAWPRMVDAIATHTATASPSGSGTG